MIKLINIITQIIIILGCCAILIFTLSIAIAFTKGDFATITNIYDYVVKQKNFIHIQIYSYTDVLNVEKLNLNTESKLK